MSKIIDKTKEFSSFIQNLYRMRQEIYKEIYKETYKESITKGK